MIRFLIILACLGALLVGLLLIASRFTITVTIRPLEAAPMAPREIPAEPAKAEVRPENKPVRAKVDSHHTKGA